MVSGVAGAQALSLLFMPLITRLYGPEEFGVLGTFTALTAILMPISALAFPIAIVLPDRDADARQISVLSIKVATVISLLMTLLVVLAGDWLAELLGLGSISDFLFLLPVAIMLSAFLQVNQQWLIRKREFRRTANAYVGYSLAFNLSKVVGGVLQPVGATLVVLFTASIGFHSFLLSKTRSQNLSLRRGLNFWSENLKSRAVAVRYRDFPFFRAPQVFTNAVSQSFPIVFLAALFGASEAGFYALAKTVMSAPILLVAKSVGDVFYPRVVRAVGDQKNVSPIILKTTAFMGLLGILPFFLVVLFGPWLFSLIFGSEWSVSGDYASWMALWLFFGFVNRPSVVSIAALRLQRQFLIYEVLSLALRLIALYAGFLLYNNDVLSVALLSVTGAILNAGLIGYVIVKANSPRYSEPKVQ